MSSEYSPRLPDTLEPSVADGVKAYFDEMRRISHAPPDDDEIIADESQAQFELLVEGNPAFVDEIVRLVEVRGVHSDRERRRDGLPVSGAAGIVRAGWQGAQLAREEEEAGFQFPRSYSDISDRSQRVELIKEDLKALVDVHHPDHPDARGAAFSLNNYSGHVMTTHEMRYLAVELIMQSLGEERFPDGVRLLDMGASVLLGVHKLAAKDIFPFDHVDVMRSFTDGPPGAEMGLDPVLTNKANALVGRDRPSLLKGCVAVDLMNPRNPDVQKQALGSMRPSELDDVEKVARFKMLANLDHAELGIPIDTYQCDYTSPEDMARFRRKYPGMKFDVISYLTTLNQIPRAELGQTIEIAKDLLSPNGIILIGDFAYINNPAQRKPPLFYQHWHIPYRYRYFALDPLNGTGRWQELLRSDSSRVKKIQFQIGRLMVGGTSRTLEDLILNV